jgi:translocation and assembly module TamB
LAWRALRWLAHALAAFTQWLPGAVVATALAVLAALWFWAGTPGSLALTLQAATPWVPELSSLHWTDLHATLREGGQASRMTWQRQGLDVEIEQPRLQWQLIPLLRGQGLPVTLQAQAVRINDQRPASPKPLVPPTQLALPVAVHLSFDVAQVGWHQGPAAPGKGTEETTTGRIRGEYTHNLLAGVSQHRLQIDELVAAQGQYQLQASLQSAPPMALTARLQGTVGMADGPKAAVDVQAQGPLAGPEATVAITAEVQSSTPAGPGASLQARVHPWQAQPILDLKAQLRQLDLAVFWPGLPKTALSGSADATPEALPPPRSGPPTAQEPTDATPPTRWQVRASLTNATPGPWDAGHLPLDSLQLAAEGSAQAVTLTTLQARAGGGLLQGQGQWQAAPSARPAAPASATGTPSWRGTLQAQGVRLDLLHRQLPAALLGGSVQASRADSNASGQRANGPTSAGTWVVLDLAAHPLAGPPATRNTKTTNSKLLISIKREAHISSEFSWDGAQALVSALDLALDDARLQAHGRATPASGAWDGEVSLHLPGLSAQTSGALSPDAGQGQLHLALDNASALAPWLAQWPGSPAAWRSQPPSGHGQASLQWRGGWRSPALHVDAQARIDTLSVPATPDRPAWGAENLAFSLQGATGHWQTHTTGQIHGTPWLARLDVAAEGSTPLATWRPSAAAANSSAAPMTLSVSRLKLDLGTHQTPALLALESTAPLALGWRPGEPVTLGAGGLRMQPLTASGPPPTAAAQLTWQPTTLGTTSLQTEGALTDLAVLPWARLLGEMGWPEARQWLAQGGLSGDLTLQSHWHVRWPQHTGDTGTLAETPRLQFDIRRQRGDLSVLNSSAATPAQAGHDHGTALPLGLEGASLHVANEGDTLSALLDWNSARAGHVHVDLHSTRPPGQATEAGRGWLSAQAPLKGVVSARLPDLNLWSRLAPPGWRMGGQLALDAQIGGTLGHPDWRGTLTADQLALRSVVEGISFGNGQLRATLNGERMDITRLTLEGAGGAAADGTLTLTGSARWPATTRSDNTATNANGADVAPSLSLQAEAQRLRVSARADRRLSLSGQATATLEQGLLKLRGTLGADQALFVLPDETAPGLGDDVVVRLSHAVIPTPATATSAIRTDVDVQIDLGKNFEVRGQGLQTRLSGTLHVTSSPQSEAFRVVGEVRAVDGSYRAYGQQLRIDDGVLRFSGPYDDPALSILALRGLATPGQSSMAGLSGTSTDNQQVGVKITGSARAPRVQLYANPDLPDSEKLAWLVLGRPASGVGAETAVLQQAALALLGRNAKGSDTTLASALGLDDISLRGNTSTSATGSTTQSTTVALGKRISNNLYVAYEHSLASTTGVVSLFYDVSRRFTVRAQAGQNSALDLIFTVPHD